MSALTIERELMLEGASRRLSAIPLIIGVPTETLPAVTPEGPSPAVGLPVSTLVALLRPGDAIVLRLAGTLYHLLVDHVSDQRVEALALSPAEMIGKAAIGLPLEVASLPNGTVRIAFRRGDAAQLLTAALVFLDPDELASLYDSPGCLPLDPRSRTVIGEAVLASGEPEAIDLGLRILRDAAAGRSATDEPLAAAALLRFGLMRAFYIGLGALPESVVAGFVDEVEELERTWGEDTLSKACQPDQLYLLAYDAFRIGQTAMARILVASGLENWPDDVNLLSLGARLANDAGDYQKAERYADRLLAEIDDRIRALVGNGTDPESLRRFLEQVPRGPYPTWLRSRRFHALQQKAVALQVAERNNELRAVGAEIQLTGPSSALGYVVEADANKALGRPEDAITVLIVGAQKLTALGLSSELLLDALRDILKADFGEFPADPASTRPGCPAGPPRPLEARVEARLRAELALQTQGVLPYGRHLDRLFRLQAPLWMVRDDLIALLPTSEYEAVVALEVEPYHSSDPAMVSATPEELWCRVRVGDSVHLTDRLTHHISLVYAIDPEAGWIRFADGWPEEIFLLDGLNGSGVAAELVAGRAGRSLVQISRQEFLRVAAGLVTAVSPRFADFHLASGDHNGWRSRMQLGSAFLHGGGATFEKPGLDLLRQALDGARAGGRRDDELLAASRLHAALKAVSVARYWRSWPDLDGVREAVDLSEEAETLNTAYVAQDQSPATGGLYLRYTVVDYLDIARAAQEPGSRRAVLVRGVDAFPRAAELLVPLAETELANGDAEFAFEHAGRALMALDDEIKELVRPEAGDSLAVFLAAGRGQVQATRIRQARARARGVRVLAARQLHRPAIADCAELAELLPILGASASLDPQVAIEASSVCAEPGAR